MIIKTTKDEIQNYLKDASNFEGKCDAVYFPENEDDVIKILKQANSENIKITISGNRTGLTGGGIPQSGIVLSTVKLNRIIKIDKDKGFVIVEPGVVLSDLQNELILNGMFYPPDPTETNCFIGGTIATNASGSRTFKYGPTRKYVYELTVILAGGNILKLKRGEVFAEENKITLTTEENKVIELKIPNIKMPNTKNASGYFCKKNMDAIDLFIGSEGTLGVVTNIKLKIFPLIKNKISCVVFFENEQHGLLFIKKAREMCKISKNNIDPLALEFFDEGSLNLLSKEFKNIPNNAKCAVWFEQEYKTNDKDLIIIDWINLITECSGTEENCWFALNEKHEKKFKYFRHLISLKINDFISQKNLRKLGTDVSVPDKHFEELYFYAKEECEKVNIRFVNFGHFGNSHMHFNFLPENEKENKIAKNIYDKICEKAIELNGTVSAEHGIGKTKKKLLLKMYGEEILSEMFEIKKKLDPNLILGIGNLFLL